MVDDIEAVPGKGYAVSTCTDNIGGVPLCGFIVVPENETALTHSGFVRWITAADAREMADLLMQGVDKYDGERRERLIRYAEMFRETAEAAEAGGLQ